MRVVCVSLCVSREHAGRAVVNASGIRRLRRSYSTARRSYSAVRRLYSAAWRSYSAVRRSYSTVRRLYSTVQRSYNTAEFPFFGCRFWPRGQCSGSRRDLADRIGAPEFAPRPKSAPEQRNIAQIQALSALFRAQIGRMEHRAGHARTPRFDIL